MAYYDLFLAPIADTERADFDAFLKKSHALLIGYGATDVIDLWGDDIPDGTLTSFPMALKLEAGESISAGWVVWPSKNIRDAGWQKMMSEDPDMEMPFDGKRMIFGGFEELLVSKA